MIHEFYCETCKKTYDEYIPASKSVRSFCPICHNESKKVFGFYGIKMSETWPQENIQAGKTFDSRYQEDKWFEENRSVRV